MCSPLGFFLRPLYSLETWSLRCIAFIFPLSSRCQDYFSKSYVTRFIGFYGHPNHSQWPHSWELLHRLSQVDSGPWICYGDFNEILFVDERSRPRFQSAGQIYEFQRAIGDCHLMPLDFVGYPFTWTNNRKDAANVQARLDRGFSNSSLCQQ